MNEIVNKVALSGLIEFDLEEYYDKSERVSVDLKEFLTAVSLEGEEVFMLREKVFREKLSQAEFSIYKDKLVYIECSVDVIVPTWAYMLLSLNLNSYAKKVIIGTREMLENILFHEVLTKINAADFLDGKVIIKGCSKYNVPVNAYAQIAGLLKPFAKSIMYGEPCSTVPLYKKQNKS